MRKIEETGFFHEISSQDIKNSKIKLFSGKHFIILAEKMTHMSKLMMILLE